MRNGQRAKLDAYKHTHTQSKNTKKVNIEMGFSKHTLVPYFSKLFFSKGIIFIFATTFFNNLVLENYKVGG